MISSDSRTGGEEKEGKGKGKNEETSRVGSRTAYNIHGGNYAGRATT